MTNGYTHQTQSQEEDLRESEAEIQKLRAEIERLTALLTVETNYRAALGAILNEAIEDFKRAVVDDVQIFTGATGPEGRWIKVPRFGVYKVHPDQLSKHYALKRDAAFVLAHNPPIGTASNNATNHISRG